MSNKYYKESIEKIRIAYDGYRKDENRTLRDISKIFILVATIIIPLSSPIFINKEIFQSLNVTEIVILLTSWFSLIISLFLGLIQFVVDYNFLKSGRNKLRKIDENLVVKKGEKSEVIYDYIKKELKELLPQSNVIPLITQIIFLFIGLTLFAAFIVISIIK